jgi:hypothetical protein
LLVRRQDGRSRRGRNSRSYQRSVSQQWWPEPLAHLLAVFRQSLAETGYIEGRNVAIEYRWAEGKYDRMPTMAEELLRGQVAVILASPTPSGTSS